MLTYVITNIFRSPAKVLVNTVNTVGVMGAGIAKEFKRVYPEMFADYQRVCELKALDIGRLWLYKTPHKWVLNFPTKRHWRNPSRPDYIEQGLRAFAEQYASFGITSISFPLLGCGNGELDWESQVRPLMEEYLRELPIDIWVHLHAKDRFAIPEHQDPDAVRAWLRSEPANLGFAEVWDDLGGLAETPGAVHKLDTGAVLVVGCSPGDEAIVVSSGDQRVALPKTALLSLWQQLRASGFCSEETLPYGLDAHPGAVMSLMAALPYVRPVVLGSSYKGSGPKQIGIQLVAPSHATPSHTTQLALEFA